MRNNPGEIVLKKNPGSCDTGEFSLVQYRHLASFSHPAHCDCPGPGCQTLLKHTCLQP